MTNKAVSLFLFLIIIILIMIGLLSCGPAHHLKRSAYHLRMAIAKGAVIKTDTVIKEIQVITKEHHYDTLVDIQNIWDTVFIRNTKYSVKLKYDTIRKTEYVNVVCKPDTIKINVPVKVETVITDPGARNVKWIIGAGLLGWLLLILLVVRSRR